MTTPSKSKKKLTIISLLALLLLAAVIYLVYSFQQPKSSGNYAKDVAKPLEEALVKAGATKLCEGGDSGKGSDNKTPYYGATFKLKKDKAEAIRTAEKITKDSGYNLMHATPANRGFLNSVADAFIDDWYFDESSKDHSYADLKPGKIKLSAAIYGEGAKNDCDQSTIPAGESTIGLGVRLPEFSSN